MRAGRTNAPARRGWKRGTRKALPRVFSVLAPPWRKRPVATLFLAAFCRRAASPRAHPSLAVSLPVTAPRGLPRGRAILPAAKRPFPPQENGTRRNPAGPPRPGARQLPRDPDSAAVAALQREGGAAVPVEQPKTPFHHPHPRPAVPYSSCGLLFSVLPSLRAL